MRTSRQHSTDAGPVGAGTSGAMATDVEIERALAAITATLNDQGLEEYDRGRAQEIVTASLGGEPHITADDGGGLHDETGRRVGALRRTDDGTWIAERQNRHAQQASAEVPTPGPQSRVRSALSHVVSRLQG